jgi:long-subunit fatty acid transport protein
MNKFLMTASIGAVFATGAWAGGLDRSGQPIGLLFEKGNYAEFSFASITPSVDGIDTTVTPFNPTGTNPIGNSADSFNQLGGGIKLQFNDQLSFALIADQPFGSDITYPGASASTALGGTSAIADSFSLTALGRYQFTDRFSVHGGVRYQQIDGDITLSGLAYGGLNGYNVALAQDDAFGYVVGGAFEIPEIALRVALTYNSEITHSMATAETVNGVAVFGPSANTEIKSPAAINLDVQTGLNQKTLLMGSFRYAKWSDLIISPTGFDASVTPGTPGDSISQLEDTYNYSIGIGRKITDNFSGSVTVGYEAKGSDNLVSPLAPTNGNYSIAVGGKYTQGNVTISGGVRYTILGDARPETGTPDVARAYFADNSAISAGIKVGFSF